MAPSITALLSPLADSNGDAQTAGESHDSNAMDNDSFGHSDDHTNIVTDAYTHGYTEGYKSGYSTGYCQLDGPRPMRIAIVGMSCRLPGNVTTPDEFWELYSRARSGWSKIPKQRFESASFHHPNPGKNGCFNAVGGNFLQEDLGLFDAPFFSLMA